MVFHVDKRFFKNTAVVDFHLKSRKNIIFKKYILLNKLLYFRKMNEYTAEQGLDILEYMGLPISEQERVSFLGSWPLVYRRKGDPVASAREIYSNLHLTHGDGNGGAIDLAKSRAEEFDRKLKVSGLDAMLRGA